MNCKLLECSNINNRGLFDRKSVDQNCVFSVDQNFDNQLTTILDAFQLIEKFDQLPKNNLQILAVDRNFLKAKRPLLELSINCQKRTYGFWQLIKTF
jgi:hypothetical protein